VPAFRESARGRRGDRTGAAASLTRKDDHAHKRHDDSTETGGVYNARRMPVDSETIPVGSEAPDFTLPAIDGREVSLSDYRGRPVLLVFLRGFG
jgi:hypothetical protein